MQKLALVLVGSLVFILSTGARAFSVRRCKKDCSFSDFLNGDFTLEGFLVGVGGGVAFGLSDNLLLFLGMDSMGPLFHNFPGGEKEIVRAGYGNIFSNAVSAFTSAFTASALADMTGVSDTPQWTTALGIVIGGLVGIFVCRRFVL